MFYKHIIISQEIVSMQHNAKSSKATCSQTGSLTASPNYWDQQVDLCHFALRNLSCCHWSDLWDNLKCIFIYIYLNTIEHRQKSLKSAFIWRHFNITVHKKNSFKSIYMMAQSLTRNLSGYALFQMEISNFWGSLDSLMLCWSEVAIWHLPLRSRLHSTRALTRPAQTTQWMLYFI